MTEQFNRISGAAGMRGGGGDCTVRTATAGICSKHHGRHLTLHEIDLVCMESGP
jgi:hypothetical protein